MGDRGWGRGMGERDGGEGIVNGSWLMEDGRRAKRKGYSMVCPYTGMLRCQPSAFSTDNLTPCPLPVSGRGKNAYILLIGMESERTSK